MNLLDRSFLKQFKTFADAVRVLSDLMILGFASYLYVLDKTLLLMMYYLKHEQQCFIRYKDTRRSRVSLGLIKHTLGMLVKLLQKRSTW